MMTESIPKLRCALARVPMAYRLALIASLVGVVALFFADALGVLHLPLIFISLFIYSPEKFLLGASEKNKVKNIMTLLAVDGNHLRVGLEQVKGAKLKRVAVGEYNHEYAVLSFPYNYEISHQHLFPIQQLDSVREFFQLNYPQVELIT